MNKIFSILFAGILLSIGSNVYAQEHTMKFFSLKNPGQFLTDKGNNANMTLQYMGGDSKPQYLIRSGDSRFLLNLKDGEDSGLVFADGKLYGDSLLTILYRGETKELNVKAIEGKYNPALFSFRLIDKEDKEGDFLIESWSNGDCEGEWVTLSKGIPAIVRTSLESAINADAELFNVQSGINPVSETAIKAHPVSVLADYGSIIIKGAKEKMAKITDIYGQPITSTVLNSDEVILSVPSGIAFVTIDNQPGVKVLVK